MRVEVKVILDDPSEGEIARVRGLLGEAAQVTRQDHFLAEWRWDGRGGSLSSVYRCNRRGRALLEAIAKVSVYLGEVLGKHSEVIADPGEMVFTFAPAWAGEVDDLGCFYQGGEDPLGILVDEYRAAMKGAWDAPVDYDGLLKWLEGGKS